jgi:AcrR family transcriptional regulator
MTSSDQTPLGPDGLTEAARALSAAAAALSKALGDQIAGAGVRVSESVGATLREASDGLAAASVAVNKAQAAQAKEDLRREKIERTRSSLMNAAAKLTADKGYEGASVGDIAAAAGFTKGALYAHFTSKEKLFAEVAAAHLATLAGRDDPAGPMDHQDMLLTMEILAHAVRDKAFRAEIRPAVAKVVDAAAAAAAAARAGEEEAALTPADREAAIARLGWSTVGRILTDVV